MTATGGSSTRRRVFLGGADQVVSSLGNALTVVLVARVVSPSVLGAFAVAMAGYTIAVGFSRATVNEVVSVHYPEGRDLPRADALGMAVACGVLGAALAAAVALIAGGSLRGGLLAMAVVLPLILVQDSCRSMLLVADRPGAALVNDLLWTGAATAALLLVVADDSSTWIAVLCWGLPGAAAGLLALVQVATVPRLDRARAWEREHRELVRSFAVEQVLNAAARPVAIAGVGAVAALAATGALQSSQVLFGPVVAFHVCVPFIGYPEAARLRANGRSVLPVGLGVAAVGVVATLVWSAALELVPERILDVVFGNGFELGRPLLAPTALLLAAVSMNLGALVVLRSHRAVAASRRLRVASSIGLVVVAVIGGAIGDAEGAAWAMAIWNVLTVIGWWSSVKGVLRDEPQRPGAQGEGQAVPLARPAVATGLGT